MGIAGTKICPFCGDILPSRATLCPFCRRDLKAYMHTIIPDGASFGVAVRGEIELHDMKLAKAGKMSWIPDDAAKKVI